MARKAARKKGRTTTKPGRKAGGRGTSKKKSSGDMIISKSRTKAAAGINVSGDFYSALDAAVRGLISEAEQRALNNNRRTLRPHDL